jgi:ribosome-associated protein
MPIEDPLRINRGLAIPLAEIELRASRSSGPGGQHANVTASRIEAVFDVAASESLDETQRERIVARLGPRVTAIAQDTRSQTRNRELALERLRERLAGALVVQRARRDTKPSRGARERRLAEKRQRSDVKRARRRPSGDD